MSSYCVICSDRFRDSEHVVATTCGHIYHFRCITRWLTDHKTCPECRSVSRENRLLRLYFNVQQDDSIVSSFDSEIVTLRKTCEEKDVTIKSLNEQIKGIREYFCTTEEKYVKELSKYQEKTERLERSVRNLSSVTKNVNKLEQENRQLRSNVEGMRDVQTLVSGCQKDVQDMVDKCAQEQDFQQLATLCVVMKRELNKALESKSKLRDDVAYLTKQNGILDHALQNAKKKIASLTQQLEENDTPNRKRKKDNPTSQNSSNNLDGTYKSRHQSNYVSVGIEVENHDPNVPSTSSSHSCSVSWKAGSSGTKTDLNLTPISLSPMPSHMKFERKVVPCQVKSVVTIDSSSSSSNNGSLMFKKYKMSCSRSSALKKDENSAIQVGYNGFGGHSKTILPSARNKNKL